MTGMSNRQTDTEFNVMMIFANEMISQLKVKYPTSSIDNWKGYLVQRVSLMLQSYQTFSQVLLQDKDYITANSILRMMADNLAITKFIYFDHDGEMMLLRHYLFLLDGSYTYLNITASMEDVDSLINDERGRCKYDVQYTKEQIVKLPSYDKWHYELDILIGKGNWKFEKFSNKSNNNKYSFQDLYNTLELPPNIVAYLKYLSQFAHGLGLYSLGTVASKQNVPFLIEMRDVLLELLIYYLLKIFSECDLIDGNFLERLSTNLSRPEMEWLLELLNINQSNKYGTTKRQNV